MRIARRAFLMSSWTTRTLMPSVDGDGGARLVVAVAAEEDFGLSLGKPLDQAVEVNCGALGAGRQAIEVFDGPESAGQLVAKRLQQIATRAPMVA